MEQELLVDKPAERPFRCVRRKRIATVTRHRLKRQLDVTNGNRMTIDTRRRRVAPRDRDRARPKQRAERQYAARRRANCKGCLRADIHSGARSGSNASVDGWYPT